MIQSYVETSRHRALGLGITALLRDASASSVLRVSPSAPGLLQRKWAKVICERDQYFSDGAGVCVYVCVCKNVSVCECVHV